MNEKIAYNQGYSLCKIHIHYIKSFLFLHIFITVIFLSTLYYVNYLYCIPLNNHYLDHLLRASPTHDTILVSKLHYFSVVLALNVFVSPTTTPNVTLKRNILHYFIINQILLFLIILININSFMTKIY